MNFGTSAAGMGGGMTAGPGGLDIKKIMAMLASLPSGGMTGAPGGPSPIDVGKDGWASATGNGAGISTAPPPGMAVMPPGGGGGGGGGGNPLGGILGAIQPAVAMGAKKFGGPTPGAGAGLDATANPIDPSLIRTQMGGDGGMMQGIASGAGATPPTGAMPMGMDGSAGMGADALRASMGGPGGSVLATHGPASDPSAFGITGPQASGALPGGSQSGASPFGASPFSAKGDLPAAPSPQTPGVSEGAKSGGFLDWLKKPAFARDGASGSDLAHLVGLEPGAGGMDHGQMIAQMIAGFANGMSRGIGSGVKGAWLGAGANGVTNAVLGAKQQDDQSQRQAIEDRLRFMQITKGEDKPTVVSDGGALVSPDGKVLYENPKAPKDATGMMGMIDQLAGGDPAKKQALMEKYFSSQTDPNKGSSRVNVNLQQAPMNINIPGKEQVDSVQKFYGDTFDGMQKAGLDAPKQLAMINRADQLLSQVNYTGAGAETIQSMKNWAKGAGIDLESLGIKDDTAPAQAAQALTNQMTLSMREQAGGMPGAMSDKDRSFLESMTPNLSTTPEGRKLIFGFQRDLIKRQQYMAKAARDYVVKNGKGLDQGFFDEMAKYADANPIAPPVMTPEQAQNLAPGTQFIGVDGEVYIR